MEDPEPEELPADLQGELAANAAAAAADAIGIAVRAPSGDWHKMRVGRGVLVRELQARLVSRTSASDSAPSLTCNAVLTGGKARRPDPRADAAAQAAAAGGGRIARCVRRGRGRCHPPEELCGVAAQAQAAAHVIHE